MEGFFCKHAYKYFLNKIKYSYFWSTDCLDVWVINYKMDFVVVMHFSDIVGQISI